MSRAGREVGGDSLTDTERAIMALADDGLHIPVIAIRLQLAVNYVDRVVRIFSFSEEAAKRSDDRVRQASQRLAAACVATGSAFR